MSLYGLIVKGSEQRSGAPGYPVVTQDGEEFWVTIDLEGWVPATSTHRIDKTKVPYGLKVWGTREEAEKFGSKWKGDPWWCVPISFEVIKVEPKFKQTFDGYELKEK